MIYEGLAINNVVKVLTIPLSHPTKAVALFSIPEMLPVVLKLFGKKISSNTSDDIVITRRRRIE
jgi:hypothetical protein